MVAIHLRNQEDRYLEAIDEALEMARQADVNLQLSHIPPHRGTPRDFWPRALELIEREAERGRRVGFDAHPYLWGGTVLTTVLPSWAFAGGPTAILQRLRDPAVRAAIKANPPEMLRAVSAGEWDKFILTYTRQSRQLVGKTLVEIAAELNTADPYDAVFEILLAEGEDLFGALWVTELIEPEVQRQILRHPGTIVESDGMTLATDGPLGHIGWHPRCFGWTARLLGEHVREARVLSLEEAIHKLTLKPAEKVGLDRRGALRPGYYADLVVFDPRTIQDNASYRQPARYPNGFGYVVVNGEIALARGDRSAQRTGSVLRPGRA
jgi:N-acyl-D-aspartate/D-glutamate deacylase